MLSFLEGMFLIFCVRWSIALIYQQTTIQRNMTNQLKRSVIRVLWYELGRHLVHVFVPGRHVSNLSCVVIYIVDISANYNSKKHDQSFKRSVKKGVMVWIRQSFGPCRYLCSVFTRSWILTWEWVGRCQLMLITKLRQLNKEKCDMIWSCR